MQKWNALQLEDFLARNPKFRISEINHERVVLSGEYHLRAQLVGGHIIDKIYQLKFDCANDYPRTLPRVVDEGGYFPRNADFHTYSDGSLCLGSELKIKHILSVNHNFQSFFDHVVDPFLYSVSHRIEYGNYPFGELAHGEQGLIDDYADMFGLVKDKASVMLAFKALGKRKRQANKLSCPCGCNKRLGCCDYRFKLNQWRNVERRRWFREHLNKSFTPIERPKKARKEKLALRLGRKAT